MIIEAYSDSLAGAWDDFCAGALNASFLHSRRFLGYHRERFEDHSVLLREEGELVGLFPAAKHPSETGVVSSHPGATYGGLVTDGWLIGNRMIEAFELLGRFYKERGFRRLDYKAVPYVHLRHPAQDDLYALFRIGALRSKAELSCALELASRRKLSERRRRALKKAESQVQVFEGFERLPELWKVIEENLQSRYGAKPVHQLEEMEELIRRLPGNIRSIQAIQDGKVVAGIILFNSAQSWHAQYIASSELGYELSALDAIFQRAFQLAGEAGARYFDFGTSNEEQGKVLNDGLYRFKSEFGAAGVVHESYSWGLT